MSITDITNKIIEDASDKAYVIIKSAKVEADKIKAEFKDKELKLREENKKKLDTLLLENERRVKSAGSREVKIEKEKARRDILDGIFKEAFKKLMSLDNNKYKDLLKAIFLNIPKNTKGVVFCSADKKTDVEHILKSLKLNYKVEVLDGISGGIIFKGDDFEYDFTFDHILEMQKDKLEIELASILFNKS